MKMLDAKIQSLCGDFSLLLSAQLQKLQESNKKGMKLAENLVLQTCAMIEELKIASVSNDHWSSGMNQVTLAGMEAHDDKLNQLCDTSLHLRLAGSEAAAITPTQEPKNLGDQHQRPEEIAPSGPPVQVATTFNKSAKVTMQDVEDVLLQIEIATAKEPPIESRFLLLTYSCCRWEI